MNSPRRVERPLSPFMLGKYYRLQMTSVSSIMIRITGLGLIVAILLTVWWILAAALSEGQFAVVNAIVTSWFGVLVYAASAWAVWYHLLGGLRHFLFDSLRGMEIHTAERLGWAMFIGATVLTVLTILVAVL